MQLLLSWAGACFLAAAPLLPAARDSAPNVIYSVSGTFAEYPSSGIDIFALAGRPFSIRIDANEALQPVRHTRTSALYSGLVLEGEAVSGDLSAPFYISTRQASLSLTPGEAGNPGLLVFTFPIEVIGVQVAVSASVSLPPGTISTTAIQPFAWSVPLSPAAASAMWSSGSLATTFPVADGTLSATVGPPPPAVTTIHNFTGSDGLVPLGLTVAPDGVLYGTTAEGGAFGAGTVFQLTRGAAGWAQTVLYNFTGGSDGLTPAGGVIVGEDGSLYGMTVNGGGTTTNDAEGTVYQLTPGTDGVWAETVLYAFPANDVAYPTPSGSLSTDSKGVLYGVCLFGGPNHAGAVFQLTPPSVAGGQWTYSTLYSFTGQNGDGEDPAAGVVLEPDGSLYGTTRAGGMTGFGTVFRLTPPVSNGPWTETVLHSFGGSPDGATPESPLVASNGILYGTTTSGGDSHQDGTVFALTPRGDGTWSETVIYSFQGVYVGDGANPSAGLLIGDDGGIYGTTPVGGIGGWGLVFKLTPAAPGVLWTETALAGFGLFDGATPSGSLAGGATSLFGTTVNGGSSPCNPKNLQMPFCGTVFEVNPY